MRDRQTLGSIVLLALLLYSTVTFAAARRQLHQAEIQRLSLVEELAEEQEQRTRLEARLALGYSAQELRDLARERLGLVLPGEKLFYFSSDREV